MTQSHIFRMEHELHKLRIDKAHKARRDERAVWPWVFVVLGVIGAGAFGWQWRIASAAPVVQTIRVRLAEGPAGAESDAVALSATGYVMAAHKIELAGK